METAERLKAFIAGLIAQHRYADERIDELRAEIERLNERLQTLETRTALADD